MSEGSDGEGANPFSDEELGPTTVRKALSGQKAGEYVLGARIGEGAMGIVYKGLHPLLGRQAAVKVLQGASPDAAQRLLAEARLVAQARHPNIIDIFGFGTTDDGQPYFVMELLEGEALDLWLRARPPLEPVEAVGILKQLFSGLAAAHAAGVIHRDLKPSNLFMARLADGTHFLKVLDFGLSKRVDPASPEGTRGTIVGTPLYMAPEQTVGDPCTPASDLYAAGCIAYELLTGKTPFSSPSVDDLLRKHREEPPPALPAGLPPLLKELVLALLSKSPAQRPASAAEARTTLERVERRLAAASASVVLPHVPPPRPSRPRRPSRPAAPAPPPEPPEQATVPLRTLPSSDSRRGPGSSQERPTVRMEPLKSSSPRLSVAPSKPTVEVRQAEVEEEQTAPRELELPLPPVERASRTWWIVGGVAAVLLVVLAVIVFT